MAFWRYMEGSLQIPDILYMGQTLYKGIPVNVPAALTVLPLGDPRSPGPGQWDLNITTPRKKAIRPREAQLIIGIYHIHIKQSTLLLSEVWRGLHGSHGAHLASPRMRRRREKCYQLLLAVISQ